MRNWFWIPLAAIVGGIAGSWGPREDVERLRESVHAEKTARKVSASAGFDAFARLANIPDVARRGPRARTNELARSVRPLAPVSGENLRTNVAAAAEARRTDVEPKSGRRLSREDLRARIEEAAELWQTRVELAKQQWMSKLGVSGQQGAETFESAVGAMNEALRESMEALADEIGKAGKMTPELGLRMMGDAARVMAEAYDAIGNAVPADRRAEVSEMPVFEFIDPMVAEPLIGVQDKLDGGFGRPQRRESGFR